MVGGALPNCGVCVQTTCCITTFAMQVSLVTLDLSFISVLKVMPAVSRLMAPGAHMVVLIKPQFEAGRAQVSSGGVVKDPAVSGLAGCVLGCPCSCEAAVLQWQQVPLCLGGGGCVCPRLTVFVVVCCHDDFHRCISKSSSASLLALKRTVWSAGA